MAFRPNKSYYKILQDLGLNTGLQLCLDAGDAASYTSGQKWLDRATGYDFFLGATIGVDASDPTFNGVAGDLKDTTYWSFDGADWFAYDSANEPWMNRIHQDNAKFTIVTWIYLPSLGAISGIAGTDITNNGFLYSTRTANTVRFGAVNAGVASTLDTTATVKVGWNFCAVSVDEAATVGITNLNGVSNTTSYSYTTPLTNPGTFPMQVGSNTGADAIANSRMGMFAMWEGVALTASQIMSIYQYPGLVFSDQSGINYKVETMGY